MKLKARLATMGVAACSLGALGIAPAHADTIGNLVGVTGTKTIIHIDQLYVEGGIVHACANAQIFGSGAPLDVAVVLVPSGVEASLTGSVPLLFSPVLNTDIASEFAGTCVQAPLVSDTSDVTAPRPPSQ